MLCVYVVFFFFFFFSSRRRHTRYIGDWSSDVCSSDLGRYVTSGLLLLMLGVVFIGMGATVLAVVQGNPPEQEQGTSYHDTASTCVPILLFMALVLFLGVYIPVPLDTLLREAAALLEVKR